MSQSMSTRTRRPAAPDAVCADAVELARAAVVDVAGADDVGEHLGVAAEEERLVTHRFACRAPGYIGWEWSVTLARPPRGRTATVDEVVLLPGTAALVAPPWVPWSDRVVPGDLGVGDVLPTPEDDPRLAPGWSGLDDLAAASDEPGLRPTGWEIGVGRPRVLSVEGRNEAADRWYAGDTGPETRMARSAPGICATCGFLLPIGGPMGTAFGACANAMSPADGRVVSLSFGCGAHSEVSGDPPPA